MRRTDQRRTAIFSLYERDVTGHDKTEGDRELTIFARELVEGVEQHAAQLDRLIADNAIGWDLDRIAALERSILRVALYEMLYRPDIPTEVAIDEAVESAKEYCGAETPGFINGILGGAMKEMESNER